MRSETLLSRHKLLALLFVARWGLYESSPHVMSLPDRRQAAKRQEEAKNAYAKYGNPPLQDDPVSLVHALESLLSDHADLCPSNQEAHLSVELAGRIMGFTRWRYLRQNARNPWSFWASTAHAPTEDAKRECLGLLVYLADTLARLNLAPKDLPIDKEGASDDAA